MRSFFSCSLFHTRNPSLFFWRQTGCGSSGNRSAVALCCSSASIGSAYHPSGRPIFLGIPGTAGLLKKWFAERPGRNEIPQPAATPSACGSFAGKIARATHFFNSLTATVISQFLRCPADVFFRVGCAAQLPVHAKSDGLPKQMTYLCQRSFKFLSECTPRKPLRHTTPTVIAFDSPPAPMVKPVAQVGYLR